jgi:deoxyribonuclease V
MVTGMPSIGVAKTLFVGDHEELPPERGAWRSLVDQGEVVGAAVRTRSGVRPVYVSIGHRVSLETAIHLALGATLGFRLPEPARQADHLAGGCRNKIVASERSMI